MSFKVIATSRGFPCIVLGSYKYRKIRATAAGEIVWRCTKKSCLAQVRTNLEQTEVRNVKDDHDHAGLDPFKLKRLLTYGDVNCLVSDSLIVNRNLEAIFEDSQEVPQQTNKPAADQNTSQSPPPPSTKQSSTKNVNMQPVSPPQIQPEVCLHWSSHLINMRSTFMTLLSNQQFVDVTLACDGRSLKCHKIILSICSSYFEELLSQNPCQHPIILLKDMKFWEVEALIDFMYTGEVNVSQDKLPSLLSAAEALQIKGLAGPMASQHQSTFVQTAPLNLDDHIGEPTTTVLGSQGVRKRKSVIAALSTTMNHSQNATKKACNPFGPSRIASPEPSTSSFRSQEESPYEPPNRKSKHIEVTAEQLDIKIEPIEVDTGPIMDCFGIKEIDDGGGETPSPQVFDKIANAVECSTLAERGKDTYLINIV